MQQQSARLSPNVPEPCKNKALVNQTFQESWGSQPKILDSRQQTGKGTLTVISSLPGDPPPLSETRSGNELDPACVIRTWQADSGAAKAGAGASLCFVRLCMQDTSAEIYGLLR